LDRNEIGKRENFGDFGKRKTLSNARNQRGSSLNGQGSNGNGSNGKGLNRERATRKGRIACANPASNVTFRTEPSTARHQVVSRIYPPHPVAVKALRADSRPEIHAARSTQFAPRSSPRRALAPEGCLRGPLRVAVNKEVRRHARRTYRISGAEGPRHQKGVRGERLRRPLESEIRRRVRRTDRMRAAEGPLVQDGAEP